MKDKIVQEWFERGKRDLESAKLIYVQKGYFDEVVFLIHQAIEKYLKGYLIFHGWKLKKIHDIETLLVEAMKYDESFMEFLDLGRKITAFYYENRYPPGPPSEVSEEEAEEIMNSAERIINKIKAETGL